MISVDEALDLILAGLPDLGSETVPLASAVGHVLAADLTAAHTQPPFNSSAMDGYAVRAADVAPGRPLRLAGTSQAGARFIGMMGPGQCVRIFTGAPVPIGADAVIIQEDAVVDGRNISFTAGAAAGQMIRHRGHDFKAGASLLPAGSLLTPAAVSLAASAGRPSVTVHRGPRIAILATGDELVPPGTEPGNDQIVASNGYGLAALLTGDAQAIQDLGIVPDDESRIEAALLSALDGGVDVIITTGGASVGERDLIQKVLVDLGVEIDFWKLAMKPGKPLMFGRRGNVLIFGLPGNPVSALVTASVIVQPTVRALAGHQNPFPRRFSCPLAAAIPANGPRRHYLRAQLQVNDLGLLEVQPLRETDSAHLTSLVAADCLIIHRENAPSIGAGDFVEVMPLSSGFPG